MKRITIIIIYLLLITGAVLSAISLEQYVALTSSPSTEEASPTFCNINSTFNCDAVTVSPYSKLLGIPIASYGLVFYLALILFFFSAAFHPEMKSLRGNILLMLSGLSILASIALFILSSVAIGVICPICLGVYAVNILLFITVWRSGSGRPEYDNNISRRFIAGLDGMRMLAAGLFGVTPSSDRGLVRIVRKFTGAIILVALITLTLPALLANPGSGGDSSTTNTAKVDPEIINRWLAQPASELQVALNQSYTQDYAKGNPLAPVRIVEFSDFECPACRRFYFAVEELLAEFPDDIHLVVKNYPLDNACNPTIDREMHKNACYAAKFTRCAGEQGMFWQATERIFALDQIDERAPAEEVRAAIDEIATRINLDPEALVRCMSSKLQDDKILDDIHEANTLNLSSTPSVWINGRAVSPPSPAAVRAIVEYILNR